MPVPISDVPPRLRRQLLDKLAAEGGPEKKKAAPKEEDRRPSPALCVRCGLVLASYPAAERHVDQVHGDGGRIETVVLP